MVCCSAKLFANIHSDSITIATGNWSERTRSKSRVKISLTLFHICGIIFVFFVSFFGFIFRMSVLRTLTLITLGAAVALAQRRLALPDPRSCANRKLIPKCNKSWNYLNYSLEYSDSTPLHSNRLTRIIDTLKHR